MIRARWRAQKNVAQIKKNWLTRFLLIVLIKLTSFVRKNHVFSYKVVCNCFCVWIFEVHHF